MDINLSRPKITSSFRSGLFFDTGFKVTNAHKFIFNFAKKRGGIFSRDDYLKHLQNSGIELKMQKQMLVWNETILKKLEVAGYVKSIGNGKYQLVDDAVACAEYLKSRSDFKLGKNHIKLLEQNQDGIIKSADLKQVHKSKPQKEYDRQTKMIDGMIRSLVKNEYLIRIDKGTYQLTENAIVVLTQARVEAEIAKTVREIKKEKSQSKINDPKLTSFDRHVLAVTDDSDRISQELLEQHKRRDSIVKRILTLEHAGLIVDGKVTDGFKIRAKTEIEIRKTRSLVPDMLTKQQAQILFDIQMFSNLTAGQILRYIYKGNKPRFDTDIALFERLGVLSFDKVWKCYTLGKPGIQLLRQMSPDGFYNSKVFSRPAEMGHDVLVYSAYKEFEQEVNNNGGEILTVKNDCMLRSEDAKLYGCMRGKGEYPDLRVTYKNTHGMELTRDLEIDAGYDTKTIATKLTAFYNSTKATSFTWCCKTVGQAVKVAKLASTQKSKSLFKHKTLYISYIDLDGNMKKMRWS